jgi:hypothetical protein
MSDIVRDLTEDELSLVVAAGKLADAAVRGAVAGAVGAGPGTPPIFEILNELDLYYGTHQT